MHLTFAYYFKKESSKGKMLKSKGKTLKRRSIFSMRLIHVILEGSGLIRTDASINHRSLRSRE